MNFEFKIQNISNIDIENKKELAVTHVFEIDNPEVIEKKGKLVIAVSIRTNAETNLQAALRVFLETIKEEYYKITDETPLSALENAINHGLRMLYSVKTNGDIHTLGAKDIDTKVSFSTALIWNRVLYTNYYGGGVGYILRGSGIRDISSQNMNPNEIWTNSSILDTEDVIIIGTSEFAKAFPTNTIVENFNEIPSLIIENPKRNLIAASFIKLTNLRTVKEDKNLFKNIIQKGGIADKILGVKEFISKTERLSDRFKIYQKKKVAPVSSISGIIATNQAADPSKSPISPGKRINKTKAKSSYKNFAKTGLGVLLLAIIFIGGYYAVTNNQNKSQVLNYAVVNEEGIIPQNTETAKPTYQDLHTEIKIPESISLRNFSFKNETNLVLADNETNAIYLYTTDTNTTTKSAEFNDPLMLKCSYDSTQKICFVIDNKALMVFEPKDKPNIDKYLIENVGTVNSILPYNNKVYLLSEDTIYHKFLLSNDEPTIWVKDETKFTDPKDFAIDGNIYVLDGKSVLKFYGGNKIGEYDFADRLGEGSDIEIDLKNIYILDRQKRLVHVFNKTNGDFIKEIILTEEYDPSIPEKIIAFEKDNSSILYFLKNNKIFKVE